MLTGVYSWVKKGRASVYAVILLHCRTERCSNIEL